MSANQEKNLADNSVKAEGGSPVAQGGKAEAKIEDRTGLYLAILAFGIAMLTLGGLIAVWSKAEEAEREARMQQYYILEVDGKLIKLGVELPEGGYQRFKEKRGDK